LIANLHSFSESGQSAGIQECRWLFRGDKKTIIKLNQIGKQRGESFDQVVCNALDLLLKDFKNDGPPEFRIKN
jgi:hypothetical protein